MNIEGKVFIVTGGASGLGEGTARMLAKNGGKVVIADLQADRGEAIAKELGGSFVKCDVSQEADLFQRCLKAGGGEVVSCGPDGSRGCVLMMFSNGRRCLGNWCD